MIHHSRAFELIWSSDWKKIKIHSRAFSVVYPSRQKEVFFRFEWGRIICWDRPLEMAAETSSSSSSSAVSSAVMEEELTLTVKWSGKEYTVRVCGDDTVGELKRRICEVTNVLPKRQKLLYPKVGSKLADESLLLSQLPLKSSLKMTMIGFVSSPRSFLFCIFWTNVFVFGIRYTCLCTGSVWLLLGFLRVNKRT